MNVHLNFILQAGSTLTEVDQRDLPSTVSLRLDEIRSVYERWGQSFSVAKRRLAEDRLKAALENPSLGEHVLYEGNSRLVLTIAIASPVTLKSQDMPAPKDEQRMVKS